MAVILHKNYKLSPDPSPDPSDKMKLLFTLKKKTMRRIEFIAPVEAMRGNLSGNQDLKYAKNDNPAFDAPNGRQYARNYTPRFIGAKRAASGLKYFNTRTKSAQLIDDASKKVMATLGGAQTCYAVIIKDNSAYNGIKAIYAWYEATFGHGPTKDGKVLTLRQWIFDKLYTMLKKQDGTVTFSGGTGTTPVARKNPWVRSSAVVPEIAVPLDILQKFWFQLANSPMKQKVDTSLTPELYNGEPVEFYCHETESWGDFVASTRNTLGWVLVGSGDSSTIRPTSSSDVYLEVQPDEGDDWVTAHGNTAIGSNYAYRLNVQGD